jgi:hypothetical protein
VWRYVSLIVLCGLVLWAGGCAVCCPGAEEQETPRRASLRGTGRETGRGLLNVGFCWLEIPAGAEEGVRKEKIEGGLDIVGAFLRGTWGLLGGTVDGLGRGIGGIFEVLLSPFPPYDPIQNPPCPPYFGCPSGTPTDNQPT